MTPHNGVRVPDAQEIPGLKFRRFRGEPDYPDMIHVLEGSRTADKTETTASLEEVARAYRHLSNCDPYQDMLLVEVGGNLIGYTRVWWSEEQDRFIYYHFAPLLPEWRGKGIRRAMARHSENRLREIAASHAQSATKFFVARAESTETHWTSLLSGEGYSPVRYFFRMICSLKDIPTVPLPEGFEIRTVKRDDYEPILEAAKRAYQDAYESSELHDELFYRWVEDPTFKPELWQIAWSKTDVAGLVLSFINERENNELARKRGTVKLVAVCHPYRRKGLARALIARSFRVLREYGMTEVSTTVDTQGESGVLDLYQSMGFKAEKQFITYQKQIL
ncbi:MAG: GNAT family N-acetyltransferase [Theionarchaea archaeon]|nr:GNAT family N-acetyltransferase [Theionarchaea archaeon]